MKAVLIVALLITGCQTNLKPIPRGEHTYRCEVSDYGHVDCTPEWEFKR